MKPILDYPTTLARIRLILQGTPGSGKTALACQFPGAYVIDIDKNLGGPLRWMQKNKVKLPVGYDVVSENDKGEIVPMPSRFSRFADLIAKASVNPLVETIIIDSMTNLADVMIAEVLRQQNKVAMSKQEWGHFFTLGKNFMTKMADCNKHVVFVMHEKAEKMETGTPGSGQYSIIKYAPYWPGQLADIMVGLVTDAWHTEVKMAFGNPPKHTFMVKTMPEALIVLKNSLGLPAEFEFKWETVAAALAELQKPIV